MQQLSGQDAMFLYGEMDNSPMHIGPVLIYDPSSAPGGKVRFKDILKTFENRLDRTPLFTRKLLNVPLGLDHPFWIDDDQVDVEFHVRHIALPHPGDWRQFCIQIARLHSRPLDRARPLWEAYVIEGLDNIEGLPKGCFALFLKVHHAAMDGATGVEVMNVMHDLEPLPVEQARPRARRHMEMPPGEAEILRRVAGSLIKQPLSLSQMIGRSVPAWRRVQRGKTEKKFHSLGDKEKTRFNDRISPHRVFGALNMDFADVSAIRRSVEGVTVNDVMLTIVSGALRRYLGEAGELPERSLVTGAPVNVRSADEKESGGNIVSMMSISLCSDVDDPVERLRKVHEEAVSSKAYLNAVGARLLTDWTNKMPAQVTALGFRAAAATGILSTTKPIFNTIITNVPGPQHTLYLAGARLIRSLGAGPCMDGMGLFHVVSSYAGRIAISFQACRSMMPDPGRYEDCLRASFAEVLAAAGDRAVAKPGGRARIVRTRKAKAESAPGRAAPRRAAKAASAPKAAASKRSTAKTARNRGSAAAPARSARTARARGLVGRGRKR